MILTDEGNLLFGMAKNIVEQTETTEKIMKEVGRNRKTLKLGVPPMIGSLILPTLFRDFLPQNPDIHLDITECGKEEILKKLADDVLDIAFISHSQIPDADLDFLQIDTLEIVCSTSAHNAISQKSSVTPNDLSNVPLVMYKDGFFQSSEIKEWFSSVLALKSALMKEG